MYIALQVA